MTLKNKSAIHESFIANVKLIFQLNRNCWTRYLLSGLIFLDIYSSDNALNKEKNYIIGVLLLEDFIWNKRDEMDALARRRTEYNKTIFLTEVFGYGYF